VVSGGDWVSCSQATLVSRRLITSVVKDTLTPVSASSISRMIRRRSLLSRERMEVAVNLGRIEVPSTLVTFVKNTKPIEWVFYPYNEA
jgi:hypothetical protein